MDLSGGIHSFFGHLVGAQRADEREQRHREQLMNHLLLQHGIDTANPDLVLAGAGGLAKLGGKYGKDMGQRVEEMKQQWEAKKVQQPPLNVPNLTSQQQPGQMPGGMTFAAPAQPEARSVTPGIIGMEMPTVPPPPTPPPGMTASGGGPSPGMRPQPVMSQQAVPMPQQPQVAQDEEALMGNLPGSNTPGFTGAGGKPPAPPATSPFRTPYEEGVASAQKALPLWTAQQALTLEQRKQLLALFPNLSPVQKAALLSGHAPPQNIRPVALSPGQILTDPTSGEVIGRGGERTATVGPGQSVISIPNSPTPPPGTAPGAAGGATKLYEQPPLIKGKDAILLDAAAAVAQRHGIAFDPKKDPYNPLAQLPAQYREEAMYEADPSLKLRAMNVQELRAQRALRAKKLSLDIAQWNETHDPTYINSLVTQMRDDPDLYFDAGLKQIQPLLAKAWTQQTGLPVPRKLGAQLKSGEEGAQIALEHISRVNQLLQDPVVQQRLGPIMGRLGNIEENVGATLGLSPQDAEKIQNLRTSLNYLFFREGRALMGGRPPEQLMKMFASTTVSVKQAMPMLMGSLKGAETMANATMDAADKYRFGKRSVGGVTNPPAATGGTQASKPGGVKVPPPPAPMPGHIRVKRKADGAVGDIPEANFDPAKYDKI